MKVVVVLSLLGLSQSIHLTQSTIYAPPQANDYENEGTREQARYEAAQKAEALAQKHQAEQLKIAEQNMEKMGEEFLEFSKSLNPTNFEQGQKLKEKILNSNTIAQSEVDKVARVTTGELFLHAFKFPDVAKHEFAQQQLDEVEIAEKNLNNNIDNDNLLESFTKTATKVKQALQEKYGESWVDPTTTIQEENKSQIKDEDVDIDV